MNIIRVKVDVTKIQKEHLFKGQKGTYLDITLLPNKDGVDAYGNHYMAVQDIGKEARERGEKGPIIGNAKELEKKAAAAATSPPPPFRSAPAAEHDDVPF